MANSKSNHTRPCTVEGCSGVIGDLSITGLCPSCYSSLHGWQHKHNAKQRVEYANKLNKYINRMLYLLPDDKVQMLTTRKKYRPSEIVLPGQCKKYKKRTKYKTLSKERIIVGAK